jgi:hypothetical protein
MRALTRIFGCFFVLATWAGCGDALDLGGSGESETPLNECVNPAGADAPPVCSACGQVGGTCAAQTGRAAAAPGVETGGRRAGNATTAIPRLPGVGASHGRRARPVDPAAPLSCRYCSPNGLQSFACVEEEWRASNSGLSNCTADRRGKRLRA